jgi:ectoine hydroxylase-related dioxygenase (phytanoyl-CoA dioxygenase family)
MSAPDFVLDPSDLAAYEADGVVCVRNVLPPDLLGDLAVALDEVLAKPGPQGRDYENKGSGRFNTDTFMWTRGEAFWRLATQSALPALTARLMRSAASFLMADVAFVKEPDTPNETPWHQDQPYGWYDGHQVCSVWCPLDPVDLESGALEYVRGSHGWGRWFSPVTFDNGSGQTAAWEPMPDIAAERHRHEIVHFDMRPGDVLVHHLLALHGAPGNRRSDRRRRAIAFRYAGDDATYAVREVGPKPIWDSGLRHGDSFGCDLFPQVWPPTRPRRFWEEAPRP